MGIDPDCATGQAAEGLASGFQDASPLKPRAAAMDVWPETAHDYVIRAEHGDASGEKDEPGYDRQKAAEHAEDQQANAENGANNVAHASNYVKHDRSVSAQGGKMKAWRC